MAQFVITSIVPVLIAGVLLGRRFSVLVLVPAGFLVVVVIAAIGAALSASFWTCMVAAIVVLSCLQLGYLGAVGIGRFSERPYRASQPRLERYGRNQ
jgi:hypothetical protein